MRKLLLILICAVFGISAYSQRFDGGVLLGFSASQIDGDTYAGFNKGGVVGGFFASTELSRKLNLSGEITYYGKGSVYNSEDNTVTFKRHLNYVEVPISVDYAFRRKIYAHAGLAPAYFISGNQEGSAIDNKKVDFYKGYDIGWLLGASYEFNSNFSVRMKYTYSLFSVSKDARKGNNYGWFARLVGYNRGDYNNSVSIVLMYTLN
jgi:opacity protein-like surface antigen